MQLAVFRAHSATRDSGAETLLLKITQYCEADPKQFPIQALKGRAELLQFYVKLGVAGRNSAAFENARNILNSVWSCYQWEEEKYQSIEVMEAAMQLTANILKGGFEWLAKEMFRVVEQKATDLFGYDDERTIWILITIGLAYQGNSGWDAGRDWFEQALSGALANPDWNPKDGVVRSLENVLHKKHFSWISDEGRPFKTIFGVSGIAIRPDRLHLE